MKFLTLLTLTTLALNAQSFESTSDSDQAVELTFNLTIQPGMYICRESVYDGSQELAAGLVCAGAGLSTNLALTSALLRTYQAANEDALNYAITKEITDVLAEALEAELERIPELSLDEAIANIITINSSL